MTLIRRAVLGLAAACLLLAGPAAAAEDEVLKHVNEGVENYKAGKHQEAINSLNFAVGLIREKQGGDLAAALPPPMPGWKSEDTAAAGAAMAMMGGGATLERKFTKGSERVEIMIMTNSPMLQGFMMMMSNPAMLAGNPNSKLTTIKGQKAVEERNEASKTGKITLVLMNSMLITAEGRQLEDPETLRKYAEAVDYGKLKQFLMNQ